MVQPSFVSDLVGNSEDRFSRDVAQILPAILDKTHRHSFTICLIVEFRNVNMVLRSLGFSQAWIVYSSSPLKMLPRQRNNGVTV